MLYRLVHQQVLSASDFLDSRFFKDEYAPERCRPLQRLTLCSETGLAFAFCAIDVYQDIGEEWCKMWRRRLYICLQKQQQQPRRCYLSSRWQRSHSAIVDIESSPTDISRQRRQRRRSRCQMLFLPLSPEPFSLSSCLRRYVSVLALGLSNWMLRFDLKVTFKASLPVWHVFFSKVSDSRKRLSQDRILRTFANEELSLV